MKIKADMVKELREKSGVGMMDCKKALIESNGDIKKAAELLREKGLAKASKKAARATKEGIIDSYIHLGSKVGVLVEANCETDFVAKNDLFKSFVHDIALHIAASAPVYIAKEDVPQDIIDKEKEIYIKQAINDGKPENIAEKIAQGKLNKFYEEYCLYQQPFVKDNDITVSELVKHTIAKIGENIKIRRFARFVLGEEF